MARKKSYNLILFELQQEELMKEKVLGHKTASNMALENQAKDEYLAPIRRVSSSGSFTNNSKYKVASNAETKNQTKYNQKRTWFNSGAFDDGYQIGDVTKSILGTATDLTQDLTKGVLRIGEGLLDTGAYLVGGGAKLIGQDDFANKTSNFIKRDLIEESNIANRIANNSTVGMMNSLANGNFVDQLNVTDFNKMKEVQSSSTSFENSSLLGDKTDALVQSAGQLAGTAGLQAVGVPWWVTSGVTSFGGGTQEAFQNDATYGEAGTSALISAGAEILTEKLSGGISFGGKTLDAGLKEALTKTISNRTVKTLTKLGFDAFGEGTEEVLSSVLQNIGKKLTYEDEKTWGEILASPEAMDEYIESFIGGAALGGGANVFKATSSIKTGRDYDTNLSAREEQVVNARVQELVNEQQANGKTLTNKEIAKIEEDVITDIKKGYISTDLIENTIGKKLTAEQEIEIETQLNELLQQSKMETDPQAQQQIQEQMEVLENQLNASRELDLSQDGYLLKSYQEKELRKENYTYEKTNNAIEDGLRESASKVMNNTTRSHELVDTVAKIARDTNTKYEFTNTAALQEAGYNVEGKTINGLVTTDGKVLINIDSNKVLETILGHETTHLLEGTAEYKTLQDFTIEYAKEKGIYEDSVNKLNQTYKNVEADIDAELTADMVGELLFTDQAYIDSLSAKQPNVFQRIYDYIKHIYKKATAGSKEARQLEELKYKFDQAYKNMKKQTSTDTKYSFLGEEMLADNTEAQEALRVAKALNDQHVDMNTIRQTTRWFRAEDGNWKVEIDDSKAKLIKDLDKNQTYRLGDILNHKDLYSIRPEYRNIEVVTRNMDSNGGYSRSKGRISLNNQILNNPKQVRSTLLHEIQHATQHAEGWQGGTNLEKAGSWEAYQNNYGEAEAREVQARRNMSFDERMAKAPSTQSKIQYSLSEDNQGRTLTKEQQEFFKDSKARDENGNLLEVYHGSKNKGFNIFNYDPMNQTGDDYGKAYYFTSDYTKAEGYTYDVDKDPRVKQFEEEAKVLLDKFLETRSEEDRQAMMNHRLDGKTLIELMDDESYLTEGGEVKKAYLNLKNPLEVDAQGEYYYNVYGEYFKQARKNGNDGIIVKNVIDNPRGEQRPIDVYIAFENNQIKNIDNTNPSTNPDINLSLSEQNEIAPTGQRGTYGKDVRLEEAIAPLQETIANLTEQVQALQDNIVPSAEQYVEAVPMQEVQPTQPTLEEVQNLMNIKENQSGSEYARAFFALRDKYGQTELYKSLNEYYSKGTVTQPSNVGNIDTAPVSQEVVEQQGQEAFNNITENEMPPSFEDLSDIDFETNENTGKVESPFDERDIDEVGNRKVKAYQYENPEVRPYFQAEAQNMIYDLDNTIKGEKGAAVDEFGEYHYYGITRQTTEAIAYLKDNYGYSYDQIRKGLNDIIEDNGKENNAVAKRIEFMLDERLREGYTTSDGIPIPPNQEYINFLNEKQITEYNKEAFNALSDNDVPIQEEVQPIKKSKERLKLEKELQRLEGIYNSGRLPSTSERTRMGEIQDQLARMDYWESEVAPKLNETIQQKKNIVPEQARMTVEPNNTQTQQSIPIKENAAQNVNTDAIKAKERSWAKTSTESDAIKGKISLNDLDAERIKYTPITNKATLEKANAKLNSLGYEKALEHFNSIMSSGKMPKVEDVTLGQRLVQEATARGEIETAIEIIEDLSILDTEMGQIIQSTSIIQRLTPAGQLRMAEKLIQRGQIKGDKAFKGVKLTDDMKKRIMECYNEDGQTYDQDKLNETMEQIKQELADQMPVTKMEKANAWRYFAMLGNPKTHGRNIISNVASLGVTEVKNALARTIEEIAPVENRTKTWKPASEEVKDFAKLTTLEMKDVILGENQVGIKAEIKSKRQIIKNKILNKLFEGNSDLMTKEDWYFSRTVFKRSLQEFLTANGISTQEDIQNNPKLVEKGKQYALEQAQIATFRQYSWLASKINEIERKNAFTQIAVGSVLPFKKTPINIAKAGLSYSPLGFAKTLTYDIAQVQKGNMEASTLIDHIAQNTTGTALTLIGYMLSQMGFLNGAGEDDKEGKYDYQLGKQGYSLNIGGNTYSLSWLSPIAMPLMVGANAHKILVEQEEWNPDVVIDTLGQTLDPLSEMSFLSSLTDTLSSYESGGIQKLWGMAEAAGKNYVTQFIPTLSSQIAGTIDDTKRSTKVSGDSTFKLGEELYNQIIYKIPGLRQTLEPSIDIWGNEIKQTDNLFQRAFENFIYPYSRKENIATEIDEELKDLYSQTGDNGILPNIPYNYVNYDGEKYKMSAEEYTDYKKTYGQTANDLLEDLFRTTTYKVADSEDRTDMVNDVYDYARDIAHKEYLAKEGVKYTNATKDDKEYYKENDIKGAIENDMSVEEYRLYKDDPNEYEFLKKKDISYRRKYFDTNDSLKDIDKAYDKQKENIDDEDELEALSADKKTSIIESIVNSGLEDTEKASLYKKYYNTDTVDNIVKSAINIDDYLTYETKEFKADKNAKGNSIPGSRKDKVINYVNTLDLDIAQKAILIKSTNTFKFNDYNTEIVNYVGSLDIEYDEKVKILKDLDMTVKGDMVYWD